MSSRFQRAKGLVQYWFSYSPVRWAFHLLQVEDDLQRGVNPVTYSRYGLFHTSLMEDAVLQYNNASFVLVTV